MIYQPQRFYQAPLGLLNLQPLFMTTKELALNPSSVNHATALIILQFKDGNIPCYLVVFPIVIQKKI